MRLWFVILTTVVILWTLAELGEAESKRRGPGRWRHRGRVAHRKGNGQTDMPRDKAHQRRRDRNDQRDRHRHRSHGSHNEHNDQWNRFRDLRSHLHQMFSRNGRHAMEFFDADRSPFLSFDLGWNLGGFREQEPWWSGPNVCDRETENSVNRTSPASELMRHFSTSTRTCDESETLYKCTTSEHTMEGHREVVVVYECCHGYTRKKGQHGCPTRLRMRNLIELAETLGLTDFTKAIKTLDLTSELEIGNYTVFAPINGAFGLEGELIDSQTELMLEDVPNGIFVSEPAVSRVLENLEDAILGHLVEGALRSHSLEDERILETASSKGSTIRINYFTSPEQVMTANCVPVMSRDNMATNGVIHTVKTALKPVTKSVLDLIKGDPDLSTLKTVLAAATYVSELDSSGDLTVLAPTNAAFDKMDARLRERLLRGDGECVRKLLLNHLLPFVICSAALKGEARTKNLLHRYVNVSRSQDNKLFVNNAQVVYPDVMATNGVIHIIDDVLIPDEAYSLLEVLQKEGHTELVALMERAGLDKTLETSSNLTVFAPSNEAIQNLPTHIKKKMNSDPEFLNEILTYHVTPSVEECRGLYNNQLLPTLGDMEIRINNYLHVAFAMRRVKTAQCAPIGKMNMQACNGRINAIEHVMVPPQGNVVDVLALHKQFSILVSLLKKAGLADTLQEEGPFTVVAPNNKAFESVDEETMQSLETDPSKLEAVLKNHVLRNTLCCAGIFHESWHRYPQATSLAGGYLRLTRDRDGTPTIGQAKVLKCDLTATNGNVLEIDRILLPQQSRRWPFDHLFRWHGFEP